MKRPSLSFLTATFCLTLWSTPGSAQVNLSKLRPQRNTTPNVVNRQILQSHLFSDQSNTQPPPDNSPGSSLDRTRVNRLLPHPENRTLNFGPPTPQSHAHGPTEIPTPTRTLIPRPQPDPIDPLASSPPLARSWNNPPAPAVAPLPPNPIRGFRRSGDPLPVVRRGRDGTPLRLVAVLGDLRCYDVTDGGFIEAGDDQLRVAVGGLVRYTDGTYRAFGDYLGHGEEYGLNNVSDEPGHNWREGPFLEHPIMTATEDDPASVLFEAASPGREISYVRLAVSLYEWDTPDRGLGPELERHGLTPRSPFAGAGNTFMTSLLNGRDWNVWNVGLGPLNWLSDEELSQGRDVSDFGKILELHAMQDMEGTNSVTNQSDRIGIAEWRLTAAELSEVRRTALSISGRTPDAPSLRSYRDSLSARPAWVRQFDRTGDNSHYRGEIWFLVLEDSAFDSLFLPHFGRIGDAEAGR